MQKNRLIGLKFAPITILIIGLITFFYFRLYDYISFQTFQNHREFLLQWTNLHPILSAISFMSVYTIAVAISMPNAIFLTIFSGFLFGPWLGTIYVVFSASLGASIIFLAAKTAFHDLLFQKAKPWLSKMKSEFKKNAISYLLFLRLIPLFPFWLINIVPAFLGINLRIFFITTFIGIIPGTFVYALLGNGIGVILDQGKTPDLQIIFKPEILIPLLGLAALSLIPILYKRIKQHGKTS